MHVCRNIAKLQTPCRKPILKMRACGDTSPHAHFLVSCTEICDPTSDIYFSAFSQTVLSFSQKQVFCFNFILFCSRSSFFYYIFKYLFRSIGSSFFQSQILLCYWVYLILSHIFPFPYNILSLFTLKVLKYAMCPILYVNKKIILHMMSFPRYLSTFSTIDLLKCTCTCMIINL